MILYTSIIAYQINIFTFQVNIVIRYYATTLFCLVHKRVYSDNQILMCFQVAF